jgi:hypothetical protein
VPKRYQPKIVDGLCMYGPQTALIVLVSGAMMLNGVSSRTVQDTLSAIGEKILSDDAKILLTMMKSSCIMTGTPEQIANSTALARGKGFTVVPIFDLRQQIASAMAAYRTKRGLQ